MTRVISIDDKREVPQHWFNTIVSSTPCYSKLSNSSKEHSQYGVHQQHTRMRGSFRHLFQLHIRASQQKQSYLREIATSNDAAPVAAANVIANANANASAAAIQNNPTCAELASKLTPLVRHGPGDGVVKLNVGGKEFLTLRSTVQSNAVLADYVSRAEANSEYNGTAIFIDRDPTHFGMILTFLRNKMEGIAYNSKFYPAPPVTVAPPVTIAAAAATTTTTGDTVVNNNNCHKFIAKLNKKPKYVRLPTDQGVLQDLYVEACHYQIYDLQSQLCEATFTTSVISYFGGGGNPYQQASEFFKRVRNWSAVALVGTTTTGGAMVTLSDDWKTTLWGNHLFPTSLPPWDKTHPSKDIEPSPDLA
jgi:BTB/POZ domain